MIARALVVWFVILLFANVNGAARELLLVPAMGAGAAEVVSVLVLCAVVLIVARLSIVWIAPDGAGAALAVGVMWLALTLAFEFLGGHYLFGTPWGELTAAYDVASGQIWPLVIVTVVIAPWLFWRWGTRSGAPGARRRA